MKNLENIELVTWDIEGTLFEAETLKSPVAKEIVRSNSLILLPKEPQLPLKHGVLELMRKIKKEVGGYQGVVSDFAYQFAINYLTASEAREIIDPTFIFLAHEYAWAGMMLDGQDYDKTLEKYAKPSPEMLNLAHKTLEDKTGVGIPRVRCLFIGDQEKDENMAANAGWKFSYIGDALKWMK